MMPTPWAVWSARMGARSDVVIVPSAGFSRNRASLHLGSARRRQEQAGCDSACRGEPNAAMLPSQLPGKRAAQGG